MPESLNILFTAKEQVTLERSPVAEPGPGEVLVRTTWTLVSTGTECICYGQLYEPGTHWERYARYPMAAGYSHAGVVERIGPGVTDLAPGDRVASFASHRQWVCAPAGQFLRVPEGVSDEEATFYALATVAQNAVRRAAHEMGDIVAVIGLGILGQLVVQYARVMGAWEVIAIDPSETRLGMAAAHGATHTLCCRADAARDAIAEITRGRMADVVYDVTGFPEAFAPAQRLARRFGCLVLLGDSWAPSEQRLTQDFLWRGLKVIGTFSGDPPKTADDHHFWTRPHMCQLFFDYLRRGQMRVRDLITHRFHPEQAPEVYPMLLRDRSATLGVLFDWRDLA
jgi:2-desacetyl-2-hydroxyethyl bacteriochlorophyllide A dehydrogenase